MSLLQRWAAPALVGALAARILLDLLWWVPMPWGNLPRVASGVLAVGFLGLAIAGRDRLRGQPLIPLVVVWIALLGIGLLRTPVPDKGIPLFVQYASPPVLALAIAAWLDTPAKRRALPRALAAAGAVPVAISLGFLFAGQPAEHVMHGYPRLIGGYLNLHAHALAMAFLVTVGGFVALADRGWWRWAGGGVCLGAAVALMATWVRTGMIVVFLVGLGALLLRKRHRLALGLVVLSVLLVLAIPPLRERFTDLRALVTLTPPERGWDWLGTGRLGMWRKSFAAWTDQGPAAVLLGTGLGGHLTFWKARNPHNEYLLLLYQVGLFGPALYLALVAPFLRDAWRGFREASGFDRALATYALALGAAILLVNAISNTFVSRLTVAWLAWGVFGAAAAARLQQARRRVTKDTGAATSPSSRRQGASSTRL